MTTAQNRVHTAMNKEQQRIAIALATGWAGIHEDQWLGDPSKSREGSLYGWSPTNAMLLPLPDFLNDLNAMAEAEKAANMNTYPLRERYLYALMDIVKRDTPECMACCAAAPQRAEAFLRALGLWTPSTD